MKNFVIIIVAIVIFCFSVVAFANEEKGSTGAYAPPTQGKLVANVGGTEVYRIYDDAAGIVCYIFKRELRTFNSGTQQIPVMFQPGISCVKVR